MKSSGACSRDVMKDNILLEKNKLNLQRQKFPALANKSYLNFGAQGVMPASSIEKIRGSYDFVQEHGPLSYSMFQWIVEQVSSTKKVLAEELGGDPASFALTQNATEGCNIILWGLDFQSGETLLTTDSEHNGVMLAAMQVCKRKNLNLAICKIAELDDDNEILAAIERSLEAEPKTRLLMLSHVLWNTGRVLPVEKISELCRSKNVKVLVDGAQSAGVLDINLRDLNCDFYAITGHKWFGGPEGTGALYLSPEAIDSVEPTFAGWRGAVFDSNGSPTGFASDASKLEVATAPFPLLAGLCESIKVHNDFASAKERYELISRNALFLKEELSKIPGLSFRGGCKSNGVSGLLSFKIENRSQTDIVKALEKEGFILRTIPSPVSIRASLHYFSKPEAEAFSHALKKVLA